MLDEQSKQTSDSTHSSGDRRRHAEGAGEHGPQAAVPPGDDPQKTVISSRPPISEPDLKLLSKPYELGRNLEGQKLGHFMLEEFVGGGGMGAVFRATDIELGRTVAVKVVSHDQQDDEILRRFKNEAQSAARLDHPNIARVYYVGKDRGWNYIVFEYIEGVNVRDLVDHKGPLSLDEAVYYTRQIAEALDHACRRDVVHRDIKPSNIIVTATGRAKLVDMGLARLHQVETSSNDLTASGVTLGTFDYISPEQARDPRNTDVRGDLYSLGCTLYFMLTGFPPFPDGTVLQKLLSHSSEAPPDPRQYRPDLPDRVVKVLHRLLAKQPEDRYQEPSQLVGELILLADEMGLPHSSEGGTVWISSEAPRRSLAQRHLPWLAPTGVLLLAALLVDVTSRSSPSEVSHYEPVAAVSTPDTAPSGQPSEEGGPPPAVTENASNDTGAEAGTPTPSEEGDPDVTDSTSGTGGEREVTELSPFSSPDDLLHQFSLSDVADILEPAEADPELIRAIVVSEIEGDHDRRTARAPNLGAAITQARDMPALQEIILRGDTFVEEPLAFADLTVMIRAADGYRPTILFRPTEADLSKQNRMIRVVGGDVTWRDIDFWMEAPPRTPHPFSLFQVNQVEQLTFDNCTMTLVLEESGYNSAAAFFELEANHPPSSGMMGEPADMMLVRPQNLELIDCVVRGRATLLRATETVPVGLTWKHGLFVSDQRLLSMGGADFDPTYSFPVTLELRRVTALAARGLCQLDGRNWREQAGLRLEFWDSVLWTDDDVPLVEHLGVSDPPLDAGYLAWEGGRNVYPSEEAASRVRWRLTPNEASQHAVNFYFDETDEPWYRETEISHDAPFDHGVWDLAVDKLHPRAFRIDSDPTYRIGADVTALPEPPEPPERPMAELDEPQPTTNATP